jgi:tellurite resistance protein
MLIDNTARASDNANKLEHLPVSLFATIMGLSGLTIAWSISGWSFSAPVTFVMALVTSLIFVLISALYCKKMLNHPQAVLQELKHPIRINFFPAFSISLMLLSVVWKDYATLSVILWGLGTSVQLGLTLFVMSSWINHGHYTISHVNPSWFIPVVGNIIVPLSGVPLAFYELSWFFFSIGIVFWVILFTVVFYRLFFHEQLPPKLFPMLFILLAPPTVGFVSYTNLNGEVDNFARILYYIGVFLAILLSINVVKFTRLPFFLTSWAYSFPLASLTIATIKMSHLTQNSGLMKVGQLLLVATSVIIAWLVLNTIKAIKANKICVPE